jgi:hypothetical protein
MGFIDVLTYTSCIILICIVRCKKKPTNMQTTAAKLEREREVDFITTMLLTFHEYIIQAKITKTVTSAVLVHFICATIPIICYFTLVTLATNGTITWDVEINISKFTTLLYVSEGIINAYVYFDRLPGFRAMYTSSVASNTATTTWYTLCYTYSHSKWFIHYTIYL